MALEIAVTSGGADGPTGAMGGDSSTVGPGARARRADRAAAGPGLQDDPAVSAGNGVETLSARPPGRIRCWRRTRTTRASGRLRSATPPRSCFRSCASAGTGAATTQLNSSSSRCGPRR
jgi:hypothetical protein